MKRLVQCAVIMVACLSAKAQGTFEALASYHTTAPVVSSVAATAGWLFSPVSDIDVLALGCYDYVVADRSWAQVGLWDASGVLLASNVVTSSSTMVNETRYENLGSTIKLTASQTYYLGAYVVDGFGVRVIGLNPDETFTTGPAIIPSSVGSALGTGGFDFPAAVTGGSGLVFLAPNLLYTVPEPSGVALFGLAAAVLAWRRFANRR